MRKLGVKKIRLIQAEGPAVCCGPPARVCHSWEEAEHELWGMRTLAPKNGSYYKVDFEIEFEGVNGYYTGRYDLQHYSMDCESLATHVRRYLTFLARYSQNRNTRDEAKDFLCHYDV